MRQSKRGRQEVLDLQEWKEDKSKETTMDTKLILRYNTASLGVNTICHNRVTVDYCTAFRATE